MDEAWNSRACESGDLTLGKKAANELRDTENGACSVNIELSVIRGSSTRHATPGAMLMVGNDLDGVPRGHHQEPQ